ncbi:restriction endonuclease domain-containing protein [Rhizobium phaseoli]|uniref:endonuclease NucS domain-containing protein n=1 Tax=Rhizobium phaseoli TaxID=396 RepID=UPI0007EB23C0|nr:endonuclease NucS domain-containing protein [Rhizobium phaseoli]ANL47551.1 restriction endonuclease domain-containing protein [Rhizobium phaseoli]
MDISRFGLNVRDNAALAISLAARPQGTTMGEISSHTGQGQYNVFKRAEDLGHTVIRQGKGAQMRIRLIHRDDRNSLSQTGIDAPAHVQADNALIQSDENKAVVLTFALERDLQLALRRNLAQLEAGLTEADGGSEEDFRDITAKDKDGNLVVIEVKAVKAGKEAVAQLLSYMGEVAAKNGIAGNRIRGLLVAPDFQERALSAASILPQVTLKTYRVNFVFGDA